MSSRHVLPLLALAGAVVCAQQTNSPMNTAEFDCRTAGQIGEMHSRLVPNNQALSDKIRPLLDACAAFRADSSEKTAAAVIAAMGDYNPGTLPALQRLAKLEEQAEGATGLQRFYKLAPLAKAAFEAGDIVKARSYADQLLAMAPQYPKDWNYGNAIYFGHMVLGRVELVVGNQVLAENHLIESAQTPGSPQLNSFGPNTSLAKDLLAKGDSAVVLQYFDLVRNFWKMDRGKLADWTALVKGGRMPDFGANSLY